MLEAAMWSSFSVTLFTFFQHCFGHSSGGRKEITHLSFSWMTAAISSAPTTAHHFSWKMRQTATRQMWQLCAMQQRNSEMHRAEDLACKLFVCVVIAINQSMLNAISFNSLTLCCHISITLSSLLSACLLTSPPSCHLFFLPTVTCFLKVMMHGLIENQIFLYTNLRHLSGLQIGSSFRRHWSNTVLNLMEGTGHYCKSHYSLMETLRNFLLEMLYWNMNVLERKSDF